MKRYNELFVDRYEIGTADYARLIAPVLTCELDDVRGKAVVDLGCGNGRYARLMASRGASVTGIDRSEAQLSRAIAREQRERLGINYIHADFCRLGNLKEVYDVALMMFVVVDTRCADTVRQAFSVAFCALRRGGIFVIADVHPHNINRKNAIEHFRARNRRGYFDNGTMACSDALLEDGTTLHFDPNFHYRLDFILNTLADQGFCLSKFIEPEFRVKFPTHMLLVLRRP